MMRSMFSGVSGIKAHQTKMDVIGNNISNVNTVGFKSSTVTFQEVFSQTLRGSGAPDSATGRGGTNPMQVGLGIAVSAVDTVTSRGSVQRTDNPTDLSIDGDGFFILGDGVSEEKKFTRAGNFSIDKDGNLVGSNGYNVYGWMNYGDGPDENGAYSFDTEAPVETINFYSDIYNGNKKVISAQSTTEAQFLGNLDAEDDIVVDTDADTLITDEEKSFMIPYTVYDSLGHDYKLTVNLWKSAPNEWTWNVDVPSGSGLACTDSGTVRFTNGGILDEVEHDIDGVNTQKPGMVNITIDTGLTIGSNDVLVQMDFSQITQFSSDNSAKPATVNGYTNGSLINFSISNDGIVTGVYDNGQQQPLAQLSIAGFENPAGLKKVGDNMYVQSTNSGSFENGSVPGTDGLGTLNPGTLEMSNVDLSKEFTDMIVTQRGFQANGRIITSSDEMLQELVNLKR